VFQVYNKVAGSGNVVIQKRRFSIVDTHGPTIAMTLHAFLSKKSNIPSYRNEIYFAGRHQEARRFVAYITSHQPGK
jgi:hypothetical protein